MTADPADAELGRPWRGQSPDERRAGRRRRLLDAGLELFGTIGYAATSLTALCAAGNVSPRHFYDLYPGREQLLADVYDELVAETVRTIEQAQATAALTVTGQVSSGVRSAVTALTDDPRRARVVLLEIVGVSAALDIRRRSVIRGFADVIEQGHGRLVGAGLLPPRPFAQLSVGLVGAINELLVDWLLKQPRPAVASVVPVLEEIITAVYAG